MQKEQGMSEHHIVLLPQKDYWKWVKATRKFVLAFGVNLTPDPVAAATHFYPDQIITLVIAPGAYENQGDIVRWFSLHYPKTTLDIIEVSSPQELEKVFDERAALGDRFGTIEIPKGVFRLQWPTDFNVVEQPFGAHPEIYNHYGLPGHEGIDIRAPMGSNVYASAEGMVYRVHDVLDGNAYGRHIRIRHDEGYRSVYAHLMLSMVTEGQRVKAGQRIGLADATGNSNGNHLHLTLKKDGASSSGLTHYPGDIIDPTPFLLNPDIRGDRSTYTYPWSPGKCLVGINARGKGAYMDADYKVVQIARLEAVKVGRDASVQSINRLKAVNPAIFLMARLHYKLPQERTKPSDWAASMIPDMQKLYQLGIKYYEIHRSPNLYSEGWGESWSSGSEFARWWLDVRNLLRDRYGDAKFGFPGLSMGEKINGHRYDAEAFLDEADEVIVNADWIGVNCHWWNEQEMDMEHKGLGYKLMRRRYPNKLIFITEFSNVNELESLKEKGRQYVAFYRNLRAEPGVGAAFSNVMSSQNAYGRQCWRHEDGEITDVAREVGQRDF
jgi:murein DD-endopeptidase MepM/ murein hydrolase activator NlpD